MRRYFRIGTVVLILALDWAALHDIVKGETEVRAEWIFVILSLVVLVIMAIDWTRDVGSRRGSRRIPMNGERRTGDRNHGR